MSESPAAGLLDGLPELMDDAARRCAYADVRHVARRTERIEVRAGDVVAVDAQESVGIGVRVRVGGAWGFASSPDTSARGMREALRRALALAEAQPTTPATPLAPAPAAQGVWHGPCVRDPFELPIEHKVQTLLAAEGALRGDPRIVRSQAASVAVRTLQAFASTEGAACVQDKTECGGGIAAWALEGDLLQRRSYPSAHAGDVAAAGWEHVDALELSAHAPRIADEALALLSAPPCPAGQRTIVLGGEQAALQVHESIGHALELDRMLGAEASYAGTSWLAPDDLGRRRYGSEALYVTADATLPSGLGSYGWDDEGVAGQRFALISAGRLERALSSRETAGTLGLPASGGCMRADGHERQPIVRMTNVSLEPGDGGTLDELIADVADGLLLCTNRSWSIDDRRLNFQFGCELAREIRDGRLGRLYRNPSYGGLTPVFWSGLEAVCSQSEWRPWGLLDCGKGEPGQYAHVSHGTAPARFANVRVWSA